MAVWRASSKVSRGPRSAGRVRARAGAGLVDVCLIERCGCCSTQILRFDTHLAAGHCSAQLLSGAGFTDVRWQNLTGGIAAVHTGRKA
ncbi:class I SAM-dependent methyltransferase [Gordonia sp. 852002-50816_SCH5313054-c]|uniref:class I SAM-dependent methyltransferase n=1 Tax=Gordonia sp. 852002-50816_SCH5313054-c TaxID=1834093 RepID=UPI002F90F174